jgi:hypothetical protein
MERFFSPFCRKLRRGYALAGNLSYPAGADSARMAFRYCDISSKSVAPWDQQSGGLRVFVRSRFT